VVERSPNKKSSKKDKKEGKSSKKDKKERPKTPNGAPQEPTHSEVEIYDFNYWSSNSLNKLSGSPLGFGQQ
jgi:hypothetical protein